MATRRRTPSTVSNNDGDDEVGLGRTTDREFIKIFAVRDHEWAIEQYCHRNEIDEMDRQFIRDDE